MTFRFYDSHPGGWVEGANEGHHYELLFRKSPSDGQKAAIASRYEKLLAQGPAEPATRSPWMWSGRFARFYVGERWTRSAHAAFAQVRELVSAIDRIAPLDHAAFLGEIEPKRPGPPGPVPPPGVDQRKVDSSLPEMAPDLAFQRAREDARSEIVRTRAKKAADKSGLELVLLEENEAPPAEKESWGALQVPSPLFDEAERTYLDGDHPIAHSRRLAHILRDEQSIGLAYLDAEGKRREVEQLTELDLHSDLYRSIAVAVNDSDDYAVFFAEQDLYRLDFATGEMRQCWRSDEGWAAVAPLGNLWAVRTAAGVHVLDLAEDGAGVVASLKMKGNWKGMTSALDVAVPGCILAASHYARPVTFIGYFDGKLKSLATLKGKYRAGLTRQDGFPVIGGQGVSERFTVHGLEALYEKWAAPRRAKAAEATAKPKKPSKKAPKKPVLELVPTNEAPDTKPPPTPDLTQADRARLEARTPQNRAPVIRRGPSGLEVALLAHPEDNDSFGTIAWRQGKRWAEVVGKPMHGLALSIAPAGDLIVIGQGREVFVVDPAKSTFQRVDADPGAKKIEDDGASAVGPDDFVHWAGNAVQWFTRRGRGWRRVGDAKVSGLVGVDVEPSQRLVLARSRGKQRLQVFAQRGSALLKLGTFPERVDEVRVDGDRVFAIAPADDQAYELIGAAALADKKAKKG